MTSIEKMNNKDIDDLLKRTFTNRARKGYITIDGVCMADLYENIAEEIENLEVRNDDIWVCTFPKCGTTWTQEMVWLIKNNLDFEKAKVPLPSRFPFLEYTGLFDFSIDVDETMKSFDSVKHVKNLPSPRFIKTHLPYHLLPKEIREGKKKPRIVYVARNPKDACISYFHHCKVLEGYRGDFNEFCELFLHGKLNYAPYWEHILGYWEKRNEENVLFSKFEDMKSDLAAVIKRVATFLGETNLTEERLKRLEQHLNFSNMKKNPAVNYIDVIEMLQKLHRNEEKGEFIRSGEVNQWKERMSQEQIERFDEMTKKKLQNTDLMY